SDKVPHAMLLSAIARNAIVIALEMPAIDQPVSSAIGRRNTGNENIDPIATQLNRPPAATITQRYCEFAIMPSPYPTILVQVVNLDVVRPRCAGAGLDQRLQAHEKHRPLGAAVMHELDRPPPALVLEQHDRVVAVLPQLEGDA